MACTEGEAAAIARVARRQFGLVTAQQLAAFGLSPAAIRRRVGGGRLVRAGEGVYAVSGSPGSWEQAALAACLGLGPGAVLSHRSAGAAWRLDVPAERAIHVTLPYGRSVRASGKALVVHRSRSLDDLERTRLGRLPVTSPARTLVDLASTLRPDALARVVDDALCRRLLPPDRLAGAADRAGAQRRRGAGALRELVAPWLERGSFESVAEARFRRAIAAAGLPAPVVQHAVADGAGFVARTDFAWPDRMVVLEVDGFRWHADPRSHARDSQRSNRLAACGWTVLHATPAELDTAAAGVIAALRRNLAS